MPWIRNFLISCGAFWLSFWVAAVLGWPLDKLNNKLIYGDGVLSAIVSGMMSSMDRALAAVLVGVLVTVLVTSRKPELWALIVAVLDIVDWRVRSHWGVPPTEWDRLWLGANRVFPAIACIVAAIVTARLLRKKNNAQQTSPHPSVIQ